PAVRIRRPAVSQVGLVRALQAGRSDLLGFVQGAIAALLALVGHQIRWALFHPMQGYRGAGGLQVGELSTEIPADAVVAAGGRRLVRLSGEVAADDVSGHLHTTGVGADHHIRSEVVHLLALCVTPTQSHRTAVVAVDGVAVDLTGADLRAV